MKTQKLLMLLVVGIVMTLLAGCLSTEQSAVLDALNKERATFGLRALPDENDLDVKAQAWAEHLASVGSLSHSNIPEGLSPGWCSAGENVGLGPTVAVIETAYMNSAGHRANILGNWTAAGTGSAWSRDGKTLFTVQVFVRRTSPC